MPPSETVTRELAALDDALAGRPVDPDLAELAELAIVLRDERPRPRPEWGAELDARVAAGGAPARPRLRGLLARVRPPLLPTLGFATVLLLAVIVALPSLGGGGSQEDSAGGRAMTSAGGGESAAGDTAEELQDPVRGAAEQAAPAQDDAAPAAPTTTLAPATPPSGGSPRSDGRQARKVERSAALTLAARPERIDTVADGIVRVTDALGGFVATSTVASRAGGTFELRVPAARLQQALAELSRLAHVRSRTQSTQDITASYVSARDRLADARAERRSLLRRLERATADDEAASLRARLRRVSRQIAAARADLARVNNRASFATVAVSLVAARGAAAGGGGENDGWTPRDALRDAVRILEVAAGVALVALAVALPLGLVAGMTALAARQAARRRRGRALDAV